MVTLSLRCPLFTPSTPPPQVNRLGDENAALQERLAEAQGAVAQAAAAVDAAGEEGASGAEALAAARQDKAGLEAHCAQLEGELRKSKRREEKLQALQFRLREDLKAAGGDLAAFDGLRDARGLEYELDRVANRAARDKQVGAWVPRRDAVVWLCAGTRRLRGGRAGWGLARAGLRLVCLPNSSPTPCTPPTRHPCRCSRSGCARRWKPTRRCRHSWGAQQGRARARPAPPPPPRYARRCPRRTRRTEAGASPVAAATSNPSSSVGGLLRLEARAAAAGSHPLICPLLI